MRCAVLLALAQRALRKRQCPGFARGVPLPFIHVVREAGLGLSQHRLGAIRPGLAPVPA